MFGPASLYFRTISERVSKSTCLEHTTVRINWQCEYQFIRGVQEVIGCEQKRFQSFGSVAIMCSTISRVLRRMLYYL
jgi:hypothetical protein